MYVKRREHEENNLGGQNISLYELPSRLNEMDMTKQTVLYCNTGNRRRHGAKIFSRSGF